MSENPSKENCRFSSVKEFDGEGEDGKTRVLFEEFSNFLNGYSSAYSHSSLENSWKNTQAELSKT
ncbi:hypothetical protein AKJ62_02325 [candidate division MSBL1 archaeon SCGC-AAA259D14]|uniref:Uncharacterized protein n=1 Tax=candidate division MSBL1 archaeon SCGC-AAA259D14 TaxID=1698261 RepID=A0A133U6L1_9EURY|nr:hypothetical protein AKJ62_02325 [candidate division MSBL1 archaeon SCGC-AAA259D14]